MSNLTIQRLFGLVAKTHAGSGRSRSCRPGVERLEALRLMAASVVSGHAFLDGNRNGRFDVGETSVVGGTVVLRNAQGTVVATAKTDANGLYAFAADQTVSTASASVTKSVALPADLTNFDKSVTLPGFDPALGRLTSVDLIFTGSITSDLQTENLSGSSPATIAARASGEVTASGNGLAFSIPLTVIDDSFEAAIYDGLADFDGASGHAFGPRTASGSQTVSVTDPAALAAFNGLGGVELAVSARGQAATSGGGSLVTNAVTSAAAGFSVVYHYTPSDNLKPGAYTVSQLDPPAGFAPTAAAIPVTLDGALDVHVRVDIADAPLTTSSRPGVTSAQQNQNRAASRIVASRWTAPRNQPASLVLTLDGALDPALATNRSAYRLTQVGRDGKAVGGPIALASLSYDAATHTLTLTTRAALNSRNSYMLTIKSGAFRASALFNQANLAVSAPISSASSLPSGPRAAASRRAGR